ncbi:18561_t:CDS:10 [Acaulospora morrowiae]|uniref:DNA polymerase epsilon catalytic subunit n=1 Tax=Acaulospora morrowiae TaxID=94023 RepID=A0A9N9A3L7_9GLOM|nr:18561_t:CDS:10 [Acaulospora morrowiae]
MSNLQKRSKDKFEGKKRALQIEQENAILKKLGFEKYEHGGSRLGWLINMSKTSLPSKRHKSGKSAVDLFFIEPKGEKGEVKSYFSCTVEYNPYFYVQSQPGKENEVIEYLRRTYDQHIYKSSIVSKQDLKKANHLIDGKRDYVKLEFWNVPDLLFVRNKLLRIAKENQKKLDAINVYKDHASTHGKKYKESESLDESANFIIDVRECDIPYYQRVAMDLDIRVGQWYVVTAVPQDDGVQVSLRHREDLKHRIEPVILAFDIETTKKPLNFPDKNQDFIMMISFMVNGKGFLITNRDIVSEDIEEIEYSPYAQYASLFHIFNEQNEEAVIKRFFNQIRAERPTIITTYNGDTFDWPFVEKRAEIYGIDMHKEIGFKGNRGNNDDDEYTSKHCVHIDCLYWVKRDSYLPIGSQGLKRVTEAKLGYNPDELDPEVMTEYARDHPQTLARYSVSDAVATYYLYLKYIHPFIFSLCNIIPMNPDDILRKGTGTLSYRANIIMPNKHEDHEERFYKDHPLQDETYVGGHVDALEAGIFRSDIPVNFTIDPQAIQKLISEVDDILKFSIWETFRETDENLKNTAFRIHDQTLYEIISEKLNEITNYDEVRSQILTALEELRDCKQSFEKTPLIYHLDVAAMYPNIILTNRLQPDSMITEEVCLRCDYNFPGKNCDRKLTWSWRGDFFPAKKDEYNMIKNQLMSEEFPSKNSKEPRSYYQLSSEEQASILKSRLGDYCQKAYKRKKVTEVQHRESTICQRENPFYVNTVLSFRDRRYKYKGDVKDWKKKLREAINDEDLAKIEEAENMIVIYDSLQLAHKCLLNSFYGYVMRKGSRWYSMEMAGVVCETGSKIIQMARQLVEKIGRPLELDTDGIWCIFPSNFPENFKLNMVSGKSFSLSYPCTMLNYLVHLNFTNDQYHTLSEETNKYESRTENSIFFEVDGPYRAMILPSSLEENKRLKKRYAVFARDGSLQELKGFEVKRRGELKLLKNFQEVIFQVFLKGNTLEECYGEVGKVANAFLDIIELRGYTLTEKELIDFFSEKRSMSRSYDDYGEQKSTSITAAKRLVELLGVDFKVNKLTCHFIISEKPPALAVSERVIPIAVFSSPDHIKKKFLRKWIADPNMDDFDIRNILDWNYYHERIGKTIQKLITIPAAIQNVQNPVPRLKHPEWLCKKLIEKNEKQRQRRITDLFKEPISSLNALKDAFGGLDLKKSNFQTHNALNENETTMIIDDIEDFGNFKGGLLRMPVVKRAVNDAKPKSSGALDMETYNIQSVVQVQRSDLIVTEEPVKKLNGDDVINVENNDLEVERGNSTEMELVANEVIEDPMAIDEPSQVFGDNDDPTFKRRRADDDKPEESANSKRYKVGEQSRPIKGKKKRNAEKQAVDKCLMEAFIDKENSWEILQINETETPGEFFMWIFSGQKFQKVRLTVPRKFYINYKSNTIPAEIEEMINAKGSINKVNRTLPRSRERFNLFEVVMLEYTYQKNLSLLLNIFNDPFTEGVYETQVTPLDRALIEIGCIINKHTTKPNVLKVAIRKGLDIRDIERSENPLFNLYLEGEWSINFLYLAHIMLGDCHAYGLFSTFSNKVRIFILGKKFGNDSLRTKNLSGRYRSLLESRKNEFEVFDDVFRIHDELSFEVSLHVKDSKSFGITLNREIKKYQQEKCGPTILVIQSPYSLHHLVNEGAKNLLDFPIMKISSTHSSLTFDWQERAFEMMIIKYLQVGSIIRDRIKKARYAQLPLCNISDDSSIFIADILFARRLIKGDIILWWSKSCKPDFGGHEQDEYLHHVDELDYEFYSNNPGVYRNLCFEIQPKNLILNTIIESSSINQIEGSAQIFGDEMSPSTFSALKSMIKDWQAERHQAQNEFANVLIHNLESWLRTSQSKFYDRYIYGTVRLLMKKVIMQLMAEINNLGDKIVYSNFYRIIVASSKKHPDLATTYRDSLKSYIQQKPVFKSLELEFKNTWENLLWMSPNNYSGTLLNHPSYSTKKWEIKELLPKQLHENFNYLIDKIFSLIKAPIHSEVIRQELKRDTIKEVDNAQENYKEGLNFTVLICEVLEILWGKEEAMKVKRNCCDLLKSSAYVDNADLMPGDNLRIGNIECKDCGCVQAIDIIHLSCINCETELNLERIEFALLEYVNDQVEKFHGQDLQCSKCKRSKLGHMSQECNCGGEYQLTSRTEELVKLIARIENFVKEKEMKLLTETCEWLLNN